MDQKIRRITCERCQKQYIVSVLRGDREMHQFTCPHCNRSMEIPGFLEVVSPERERVILGQAYNLHLATWIIAGLSALCSIICCALTFFRSESFYKADFFSIILALTVNGSWYVSVLGLLLLFNALISQGLVSHKLISLAAVSLSFLLLYVQTRYFLAPENLTGWFYYLGALILLNLSSLLLKEGES
jgi:hypothetical protein